MILTQRSSPAAIMGERNCIAWWRDEVSLWDTALRRAGASERDSGQQRGDPGCSRGEREEEPGAALAARPRARDMKHIHLAAPRQENVIRSVHWLTAAFIHEGKARDAEIKAARAADPRLIQSLPLVTSRAIHRFPLLPDGGGDCKGPAWSTRLYRY